MNRIKKKLRSQTGASLTFALLLFLVCAVVGSAVLVAGTAAAGRMSKIAEMDQRYYSVNSAARLLIELLEKDEIWVEKDEPADDEEGGGDGGQAAGGGEDTEKEYTLYIKGEPVGDDETSLALDIAKRVLDNDISSPVTLRVEPADDNLGANLTVTVKETISSNGDVVLAVCNKPASGENGTTADSVYTITLFFMNVGGASSFKWELYDIDSKMPSTPQSGTDGGG